MRKSGYFDYFYNQEKKEYKHVRNFRLVRNH